MIITDRKKLRKYHVNNRMWQGIPGIEKSGKGRLLVTFYSGGEKEGPGNYVVLIKSEDDGITWSDAVAVIDPGLPKRAFDPVLWIDPEGKLWWFWSQCDYDWYDGKAGVWFSICEDKDASELKFSEPERIANGVMMNKPTVRSDGKYLFPIAFWSRDVYKNFIKNHGQIDKNLDFERKANVYIFKNKEKSFSLLGQADFPDRVFDEHMLLEMEDNKLLMLARINNGIGESYSKDGGKSWSSGVKSHMPGPGSRFFIRRLISGKILLINHYNFTGRNNLTAMISDDELRSFKGFLLIDGRDDVSYPDAVQDDDGMIYIVYDRERGYIGEKDNPNDAREILMAKITEEDILSGRINDPESKEKIVVSRLYKS